MLEGMTALGYMAAHSDRARLGLMVGGVHYRQPGLWAKATTTLDVLSGGRAWFGIGAAWNQRGVRGPRLPVPVARDPLRDARGHAPVRAGDVGRRARLGGGLRGPPRARDPPPELAPGAQPAPGPDHDRRRRRAEDVAPGGPVRRRRRMSSAARRRSTTSTRSCASTARRSVGHTTRSSGRRSRESTSTLRAPMAPRRPPRSPSGSRSLEMPAPSTSSSASATSGRPTSSSCWAGHSSATCGPPDPAATPASRPETWNRAADLPSRPVRPS